MFVLSVCRTCGSSGLSKSIRAFLACAFTGNCAEQDVSERSFGFVGAVVMEINEFIYSYKHRAHTVAVGACC